MAAKACAGTSRANPVKTMNDEFRIACLRDCLKVMIEHANRLDYESGRLLLLADLERVARTIRHYEVRAGRGD